MGILSNNLQPHEKSLWEIADCCETLPDPFTPIKEMKNTKDLLYTNP